MRASSLPGVFVHPQGLCESTDVGPGTRVWAFAHVLEGARIGVDCNVCDGAYVEGGAVLGDRVTVKNQVMVFAGVTVADDVFLGPGVTFTNDFTPRAHVRKGPSELDPTWVEEGATLGARVTVVCGVTIGANAFVGAGAVVTPRRRAARLRRGQPRSSDRLGLPLRPPTRRRPPLLVRPGVPLDAEGLHESMEISCT